MPELQDIRHLLIDMDGVLYRGKTALPGASELMRFLAERGIDYLMVTNNSTLTPAAFVERLGAMGILVPEERIMTSGTATAEYLTTIAPRGAKLNVVGEQGLIDVLVSRGFRLAGRDADYVVCGWDKTITYEKLKIACLAIRDGATFIGTNADKTYPLENDLIPGAGSILAALITATDVQPVVVGKPERIIFQQSLRVLGALPHETAMLGDRLDTDIVGAHRAGVLTIMVTTGVNNAEDAAASPVQPDWLFPDLVALLDAWER
jgi:4-nitrophenyl phosphatase